MVTQMSIKLNEHLVTCDATMNPRWFIDGTEVTRSFRLSCGRWVETFRGRLHIGMLSVGVVHDTDGKISTFHVSDR